MTKRIGNPSIWKTPGGIRYQLATMISSTAEEIRNANKPSDLTFPISRLIELARKVREQQYLWLEKDLKLDPKARNRWPHL